MDSDKKIGDAVVVNLGHSGLIRDCFIRAVKFTESKVLYDVEVFPFLDEPDNEHLSVLLIDVKSYYVEHPEDRFTGKTNMPFNEQE